MRILRKLHRWIGLALAIPFALQGLTGFLMVVLPQETSGRPQIIQSGPPLPASQLVEAARAAAPAGSSALRYAPSQGPHDPASVGFGRAGGRRPDLDILVDPSSGHVVGTQKRSTLYGFAMRLHTALLLLPVGRGPMGWVGVFLVGMAVSGVVLWWPRSHLWQSGLWRRGLMISRKARGLRLWRETHLAVGAWTFLFLAFMAGSGVMICYPDMFPGGGAGQRRPPGAMADGQRDHRHASATDAGPMEEDGLDMALATIRQGRPQDTISDVQLGMPRGPFTVRVVQPGYGANRPTTLRVDRHTGAMTVTADPGTQSVGQRLYVWIRILHQNRLAATWAGDLWSVLIGLNGLALCLFSVTGVAMWLLRRARTRA
ncbi:PepSY domain-containing protein [Gluconacetobacter azotocaptans]|uniref:PepSY domain-containing protein n=1 Tax=Gluconacetobacter azotocaptans TaxID=142834 RepID=A0A7W4JQ55_9PROT|nr:PepSY-associated TM helix domain-containing protein [Gluconacetobacter azotocaptans]MBB2188841.1 PepSY domain-containing protein [Gluconacetobacter azotocaptans]MBM9401608.1 PepSY domain-containing protein [Gluconacetobacter azotocaptans]